jgi:hypothetical protein
MLRVQNQAKQAVSSGLPFSSGCGEGWPLSNTGPWPKQNSPHPGPCAGTSREHVTEWGAQI